MCDVNGQARGRNVMAGSERTLERPAAGKGDVERDRRVWPNVASTGGGFRRVLDPPTRRTGSEEEMAARRRCCVEASGRLDPVKQLTLPRTLRAVSHIAIPWPTPDALERASRRPATVKKTRTIQSQDGSAAPDRDSQQRWTAQALPVWSAPSGQSARTPGNSPASRRVAAARGIASISMRSLGES